MLRTSAFAKAGRVAMIPAQYTNSLWALATAPIPEEVETHVSFLSGNKIVCACADGTVHMYQFSPDGAITRVEVYFFIKCCLLFIICRYEILMNWT